MGSTISDCPRCRTNRYAKLSSDVGGMLRYYCGRCGQYFSVRKKGY